MKIFDGLRPLQTAEFLMMVLLAAAIPLHWFAAQCGEAGLLLCAVLKLVFDQKFHLNKEQLKFKWAYIVFAMTWLVYFVGMIYTDNQSEGWVQVTKKLGFLIFPVIFIFSDMSYITKDRFRAICYAFVAGCILFFLMNLCYAFYDVIFNNATSERFFDRGLMKIYHVHHSYMSMYAGLGLMFCFLEIFGNNNRKVKVFNVSAYITLVIFIILLSSRAGLICLVFLFVIQWIWLYFIIKKKKMGLIMGCVFFFALVGMPTVFNNSFSRITETVYNLTENKSDKRYIQFKGYSQVLMDNWFFGVGTGDRSDEIEKSYQEYLDKVVDVLGIQIRDAIDEIYSTCYTCEIDSLRVMIVENADKYGYDSDFVCEQLVDYIFIQDAIYKNKNAHNMYFETLISVGIVGLLLLFAYFVIPVVLWIKTRNFDILYFTFLFIIAFNALFESLFEVQMGIIFFCFFNALLFKMNFIGVESTKNNE